ncbi:hypothetical protein NDU88_002698 [Pleurodeles waltl]|uniref:Uncharacterized protein n=1 Tax=Pleurodeles waltl TaxID=8319 RepID=A0AAV7UDX2_PLEWA|nr:hypothetical protein NDU88_002698 [Pleurodeles waltl]
MLEAESAETSFQSRPEPGAGTPRRRAELQAQTVTTGDGAGMRDCLETGRAESARRGGAAGTDSHNRRWGRDERLLGDRQS